MFIFTIRGGGVIVGFYGILVQAIHSITYIVTHEVQSVVLIRESSTQLLMQSLDTGVRYSSIYFPIFKSQKGSIEALNFLIITS